MPNVLVVDHSGRGHAFAELFTRTNADVTVYYAPGCAALTTDRVLSVPHLDLSNADTMVAFALEKQIDLAFVSNASALAQGFVDVFQKNGIPTIGPDKSASRLESSKIFTKELCRTHDVLVAPFRCFDDFAEAARYVESAGKPLVVKADGLCQGNGTFICDAPEDAIAALQKLMVERAFDDAGSRVVIEDKLEGTELLFFALVKDESYLMLPMATDYPYSDDGNTGVLCGGTGSFGPHPYETPELVERFESQILRPVLNAMRSEDLTYSGVMYIGTMLVGDQLHLLEINVRMGEPEAEVVLPRIESDFFDVCMAVLEDRLDSASSFELNDLYFCNVVASQGKTRQVSNGKNKGWYKGWPYGRYGRGYPITGLDRVDPARCKIFFGQASLHSEKGLVTDGARCIHVVGFGASHAEAVDNAYESIEQINFNGIQYRRDIGRIYPWGGEIQEAGVAADLPSSTG